jgi:serine/threonine-protein kinase HipA
MELEVWLGDDRVGTLSHDGASNRFAFGYTEDWRQAADASPLSPRLPLAPLLESLDAHSARVRQFFENLLPEGKALDDAAAACRVSKSNLTGLLATLGRETAGALRIAPVGQILAEADNRRPLPDIELSARIRQRAEVPFTVWDGKVRLSIAGYQDKLAAYEEQGKWYLVEGPNLASTHILKPEPANPGLAGLTSNEFLCMRLAEAVKLPVAPVSLRHVPEPVLVIERFDRRRVENAVRRRHVIDGCQLLGLPSSFKYERPYGDGRDVRNIRDGASLPRLFEAMAEAAVPAKARLQLLRWVLFQVLIGNTDAHAKNLSFYLGPQGIELAPAYDLVCGDVFDPNRIEQTYAMAIGDAFSIHELSPYDWALFCVTTGVKPEQLRKELERMANRLRDNAEAVAAKAVDEGADPGMALRVVERVAQACSRQLAMAPLVRDMLAVAR